MSKWVALVHRVSGIALALFLPAHFWVLGQGLAMDKILKWTEQPLDEVGRASCRERVSLSV